MLLKCMANKGAGILGSPGEEARQGKVEISLTYLSKMSSKRKVLTSPFPRLRTFPFLLFLPISYRFSFGPGEGKGVRIKRSLEKELGALLGVEKIRDLTMMKSEVDCEGTGGGVAPS